jgi:hypothetical protein
MLSRHEGGDETGSGTTPGLRKASVMYLNDKET